MAECYLSPSVTCTLVTHLLQFGISPYHYQKGHSPFPRQRLISCYITSFMQLKMRLYGIAWVNITAWITRGRSWSPFLAPRAMLKWPALCQIWCLCDLSKGCRQLLQLSGLKSHWGPELAKERGYFQSQLIICSIRLQTSKHGRKTGHWTPEERGGRKRAVRKRVLNPWDPVQKPGGQGFPEVQKRCPQRKEN